MMYHDYSAAVASLAGQNCIPTFLYLCCMIRIRCH